MKIGNYNNRILYTESAKNLKSREKKLAAGKSETTDTVEFSSVLQKNSDPIKNNAVSDLTKSSPKSTVDAIASAIKDGTYKITAEDIASSILSSFFTDL